MNMRKFFILMVFFTLTLTSLSAQWVFGGGLKFNSNIDFKALGLHAKIGKDISEKFDINTDLIYYLGSKASWAFDVDLHYRLFNISDKVIINPVAGINFTKTSVINNSLLLGASIRFPTDKYTYYLEPKWILDNDQIVIGIGVLF